MKKYKAGSRFDYKGHKFKVILLPGQANDEIGLSWGGKIKGTTPGYENNITKELLIELAEEIVKDE